MMSMAWAAGITVATIAVATLFGAWVARRGSRKTAVLLVTASAMLLAGAVADVLPDAARAAERAGVPLWMMVQAVVGGFLTTALAVRRGHRFVGAHAPGQHKRVKRVAGAALLAGWGTAAALTVHRALESGTLTLTMSTVVLLAVIVHAVGAGLALTCLLDRAGQRLGLWLALACLSPAIGIAAVMLVPLPPFLAPMLLATAAGVLLCAALIALKLAASEARRRNVLLAATVGASLGDLTALPQVPPHFQMPSPPQPIALSGPYETVTTPPVPSPTPTSYLERVKEGQIKFPKALADPEAADLTVGSLVGTLPGYGRKQVQTALADAGLPAKTRVGQLTPRQRRVLVRQLFEP